MFGTKLKAGTPIAFQITRKMSQGRHKLMGENKTMKNKIPTLALAIAVVIGFALSGTSAKAQGYSQAPPVNLNTGAEFLITWNGTTFSISAPSGEGPYDGIEDTLFGVQNDSSLPLFSLFLSGANIFGFDGDGISLYNGFGGPPGSPGPTGYEGWTSDSSTWGTGTPEAVFFTGISALFDSGTVNFGLLGISPGGSAYFALEENIAGLVCGPGGCVVPTPDSGSTLVLLGLACGFGILFQRRLVSAR